MSAEQLQNAVSRLVSVDFGSPRSVFVAFQEDEDEANRELTSFLPFDLFSIFSVRRHLPRTLHAIINFLPPTSSSSPSQRSNISGSVLPLSFSLRLQHQPQPQPTSTRRSRSSLSFPIPQPATTSFRLSFPRSSLFLNSNSQRRSCSSKRNRPSFLLPSPPSPRTLQQLLSSFFRRRQREPQTVSHHRCDRSRSRTQPSLDPTRRSSISSSVRSSRGTQHSASSQLWRVRRRRSWISASVWGTARWNRRVRWRRWSRRIERTREPLESAETSSLHRYGNWMGTEAHHPWISTSSFSTPLRTATAAADVRRRTVRRKPAAAVRSLDAAVVRSASQLPFRCWCWWWLRWWDGDGAGRRRDDGRSGSGRVGESRRCAEFGAGEGVQSRGV